MVEHDLDQQHLLNIFVNNISDVIYFKDLESRFILVNEAFLQKHGVNSPVSVIGKNDHDLFDPEHADESLRDEKKVIATGRPIPSTEEKEVWPDGRVTWALTTKMPFRDKDGRIVGTFGISRDITDRKKTRLLAVKYAEEVRAIKEMMEEDVVMAGKLLQTFMPQSYPEFTKAPDSGRSCLEFLHRVHQCRTVSGDYCAIFPLSDRKAGLFLCDVRGVGVRAALGTAMIRGIMQEIEPLQGDPGALMTHMNELFCPLLKTEEALLRVSACYLTIDAGTGIVQTANAGHPIPILLYSDGTARPICENLVWRGPMLGEKVENRYATSQARLGSGDIVMLYSSGVSNARNALDEPFGQRRIIDAIAYHYSLETIGQLFDQLDRAVLSYSGHASWNNDVCLLACRLNAMVPN